MLHETFDTSDILRGESLWLGTSRKRKHAVAGIGDEPLGGACATAYCVRLRALKAHVNRQSTRIIMGPNVVAGPKCHVRTSYDRSRKDSQNPGLMRPETSNPFFEGLFARSSARVET